MDALAIKESREVARPLKVLVPLIKEELEAGRQASTNAGLPYYRRVGTMLLEARPQVSHGEWNDWVKRNFGISRVSAHEYMALAEIPKSIVRDANISTLSQITHSNAGRQAAWVQPVRQSIATFNVERMLKERESKEKEEKLLRALGLELIDIGYKVLATKLHPDKGGTAEGMARLTRVRDILKRAL